MINIKIKEFPKIKGKWSFYIVITIIFGLIAMILIQEIGKTKRIDKLNMLESCKIDAIGNYEEKSKDKVIK